MLSPLARQLFIPSDENLLVFQKEDNLRLMLAKSFDPIDDYSISALHETLADTIVWQ